MSPPLSARDTARVLLGAGDPTVPRRRVPSDEVTGLERVSGPPALSERGDVVAFSAHTVKGTTWHPPHFIQAAFAVDRLGAHLVSRSSQDVPANSPTRIGALSADGRLVAMESRSEWLIDDDRNDRHDVFLHDRHTGRTECLSVTPEGRPGNDDSVEPAMSADGSVVAFSSRATDLVPGVQPEHAQIYLRHDGVTERASSGAGACDAPAVSADGRAVAWTGRLPGRLGDVFLLDRATGDTVNLTASADLGSSGRPALSADGRVIAFTSHATNLVPGDTNGQSDVFLLDRGTGRVEKVSDFPGQSHSPAVSGDGRFVAFTNHGADGRTHVHLHDRRLHATRLLDGDLGGNAFAPALSADGTTVAFVSDAGGGYGLWSLRNPAAVPVAAPRPDGPVGDIREEAAEVVVGRVRLPRS